MSAARPGRDEVMLSAPGSGRPCNSQGCARAGRAAEVIVTCGVLNDPEAGLYARGALWRECRGRSYPLCVECWDQSRQVAVRYRPALVVIDTTPDRPAPAAPQPSGGRA